MQKKINEIEIHQIIKLSPHPVSHFFVVILMMNEWPKLREYKQFSFQCRAYSGYWEKLIEVPPNMG